jgi:hypothetical protein
MNISKYIIYMEENIMGPIVLFKSYKPFKKEKTTEMKNTYTYIYICI